MYIYCFQTEYYYVIWYFYFHNSSPNALPLHPYFFKCIRLDILDYSHPFILNIVISVTSMILWSTTMFWSTCLLCFVLFVSDCGSILCNSTAFVPQNICNGRRHYRLPSVLPVRDFTKNEYLSMIYFLKTRIKGQSHYKLLCSIKYRHRPTFTEFKRSCFGSHVV